MGILNKIFGTNETTSEDKKVIPWNQLQSLEQLNEIIEESKSIPVAVFKHSKYSVSVKPTLSKRK